jgi:8-oxo-dGTP diphosphatase
MEYTNYTAIPGAPPPQERPLLAIEVAVFTVRERALLVLLNRREELPFQDRWALPGDFVGFHESLDESARRELVRQTEASGVYLEQLYTFGAPDRDPRARIVSVVYFALAAAECLALRPDPGRPEACWHRMDDLPPMASDHAQILEYALVRLRYKLGYTAVAFQLLPEEFTLSELQDVYTAILGKPSLDKRNFRKKLQKNNIVVPTSRFRETGGRPARLYRFSRSHPFEGKSPRLFP